MDQFALRDGVLHAEDIPLPRIAEEVGTPVYVYSRAMLERHAQEFRDGLKDVPRKHLAFAIKSNPNLGVLRVLARQGYGADVVSGGELERAEFVDTRGQAHAPEAIQCLDGRQCAH